MFQNPQIDAPKFRSISTSTRDHLHSLGNATATTKGNTTTGSTSTEQNRAWIRFQKFLQKIHLQHDSFLDYFSDKHKISVLSTVAQAMRQAEFSPIRFSSLVASIVRGAMDHVGLTFRDNFRRDPRLDEDGKPARILQKQYKGYQNKDPN